MDFAATDLVFGGGLLSITNTRASRLDGIIAGAGKIILCLLEFEGEVRPGLPAIFEGLRFGALEWVFHAQKYAPKVWTFPCPNVQTFELDLRFLSASGPRPTVRSFRQACGAVRSSEGNRSVEHIASS